MEKLFFNKGLIDSFGKGRQARFIPKKSLRCFHANSCFDNNIGLPKIIATIVKIPNISWVLNKLELFSHNSEPSY